MFIKIYLFYDNQTIFLLCNSFINKNWKKKNYHVAYHETIALVTYRDWDSLYRVTNSLKSVCKSMKLLSCL